MPVRLRAASRGTLKKLLLLKKACAPLAVSQAIKKAVHFINFPKNNARDGRVMC
jgi:hypothetical protein